MYMYFNFTVHFNYFKARQKINKMNLTIKTDSISNMISYIKISILL